MNRFDDEPLSPEERALADRLARLGPHDGPSPALDAKILAAAHAAVAPPQRRRRHWLGLSAIPGGLITGTGMAAALVLVIGTVWQLRPSDPAPRPILDEGEMAPVEAQIIARPREVIAPPPPPVEAPAAAAVAPPSANRSAAIAQRKAAPAEVAAAAPAPEPDAYQAPARVATVGPDEALHFESHGVLAPAPQAYSESRPVAAAAMPAPMPAPASASEAVDAQAEAARKEAFGLMRAREQQSIDEQTMAAARKQAEARAKTAASPTLDRVEVTGSRVRAADISVALADMPVQDDARLDRNAWLERIRARRDAGDVDHARESLALFRKAHPRVRLPQDLRALAQPATSR